MPSHKLPNYLRTHRKRAGLSQEEVAFLLGAQSSTKVSRYERFVRLPGLPTVFALGVIFQKPVEELFAGVYQEAQERTLSQAKLLAERIRQLKPQSTERKLTVVRAIWDPREFMGEDDFHYSA